MIDFRSYAIVPAAGRSRRMGEAKLLLPLGANTLIEHVLAAWRASRVSRTIVVVHREDNRLAEVCRAAGADVVIPEPPPPEMKSSVAAGLEWVGARWRPAPSDAWLFAPADLPALSTATIDALLDAYRAEPTTILAPVHAGHRGHPLLLPWALEPEVRKLGPAQSLRDLTRQYVVQEVPCGTYVENEDLDTLDDLRRWRDRYTRM